MNHNSLRTTLLWHHIWVSINQSVCSFTQKTFKLGVWVDVRDLKVFPALEMYVFDITNKLAIFRNSEDTNVNMLGSFLLVNQILNLVLSKLNTVLVFQATHARHIWCPIEIFFFTESYYLGDVVLSSCSPEVNFVILIPRKADTNHEAIYIFLEWSLDEVGITIIFDKWWLLVGKFKRLNSNILNSQLILQSIDP